jgi:hypothetical protein
MKASQQGLAFTKGARSRIFLFCGFHPIVIRVQKA